MSSNVRERKKVRREEESGGGAGGSKTLNSLFRNKGCVSVTLWPCHIYITKGMYVCILKAKINKLWKLNQIFHHAKI